jgi:SAM-dependent methyltransferase
MRRTCVLGIALLLGVGVLTATAPLLGQSPDDKVTCRIIYVPTPQPVVDKMLDMAKVKKEDHVYDLGCGDGRVVATAAKKFGAKGVGVDIDPARIKDCKETLKKFAVADGLVDIRQGDALKVKDLEKATVIILYMLPEFMEKLEKQVEKLKPGTRIVAHDYPFPNWKEDVRIEYKGPEREHTLYMWTVKEKK